MNKKFLLLTLLLISFFIPSFASDFSSEVRVVTPTDDFGDEQDYKMLVVICEGTFTNSATNGSYGVLMLKWTQLNEQWTTFYQYTSMYTFSDDYFMILQGQDANGSQLKVKMNKYPSKIQWQQFIDLCRQTDNIKIRLYDGSSYGTTRAYFKIDNANEIAQTFDNLQVQ